MKSFWNQEVTKKLMDDGTLLSLTDFNFWLFFVVLQILQKRKENWKNGNFLQDSNQRHLKISSILNNFNQSLVISKQWKRSSQNTLLSSIKNWLFFLDFKFWFEWKEKSEISNKMGKIYNTGFEPTLSQKFPRPSTIHQLTWTTNKTQISHSFK